MATHIYDVRITIKNVDEPRAPSREFTASVLGRMCRSLASGFDGGGTVTSVVVDRWVDGRYEPLASQDSEAGGEE